MTLAAAVHTERLSRLLIGAGLVSLLAAMWVGWRATTATAATPTVTMSPAAGATPYHDGESVSVAVGPNSLFAPFSRIILLECAAQGGVPPTSDSSCDGNTAPGSSILVAADGSFSDVAYPLYQLPNSALGEQPAHLPVCDAAAECVLYVGEDQNDFTRPKVFSSPFLVGSADSVVTTTVPPVAAATTSSGQDAGSAPSQGSAGASDGQGGVALAPLGGTGSLAFTGAPTALPWLVGGGVLLLLLGGAGRMLAPRLVR